MKGAVQENDRADRPESIISPKTPGVNESRNSCSKKTTIEQTLSRKPVGTLKHTSEESYGKHGSLGQTVNPLLNLNPDLDRDDYGSQIMDTLEKLAASVVQGYTPRNEKPDRSELIIPEIKYGYLSAATPREGINDVPTVEGRSPKALNGITSLAFPIWETTNNPQDPDSQLSNICDVDFLKPNRIAVSRNGVFMAGLRSYEIFSNFHEMIAEGSLLSPRGIAVDPEDEVLAATDCEDKTVKFFDFQGQSRGSWKENKFKHPGAIVRTREGRYVISDVTRGEHAIGEYSAFGKLIRKFGLACFDWPWYLTTDGKGRVIVSERTTSMVYIFNNQGKLQTKFGMRGRQNGQLNSPGGVAVDTEDNIFVADSDNYRVSMFSPDGRFIRNVVTHFLARPTSLAFRDRRLLVATDSSVRLYELQQEKQFLH